MMRFEQGDEAVLISLGFQPDFDSRRGSIAELPILDVYNAAVTGVAKAMNNIEPSQADIQLAVYMGSLLSPILGETTRKKHIVGALKGSTKDGAKDPNDPLVIRHKALEDNETALKKRIGLYASVTAYHPEGTSVIDPRLLLYEDVISALEGLGYTNSEGLGLVPDDIALIEAKINPMQADAPKTTSTQ